MATSKSKSPSSHSAVASAAAQDHAPIFVACETGNLELLDSLLASKHRKTLLTTPNSLGRYPIHIAALAGQLQVLERLVKAGYDCWRLAGNVKINFSQLLSSADINQLENRVSKWSVLHHAAHGKNKEVFYYAASRDNLLAESASTLNLALLPLTIVGIPLIHC